MLVTFAFLGALVFVGATVPMGKRTFFGHVRAIWSTPEAKDMREGVGDKAAPVVDKVKRGAEAGFREATKDDPTAPVKPAPGTEPVVVPPVDEVAPPAPAPTPTPKKKPGKSKSKPTSTPPPR